MRESGEERGEGVRLNKALADAGLCSRRKADELIFAGKVKVNGEVAESPGVRVLTGKDIVEVDGKTLGLRGGEAEPCWLMINKPVEVVATVSDPEGRRTVLDLVPKEWRGRRLYPVGRLDYFSEGLLLLTDDGELAHRLTHPRWHLPRVYEVRVRPEKGEYVTEAVLNVMRKGMTLAEGEKLAPVEVRVAEVRTPASRAEQEQGEQGEQGERVAENRPRAPKSAGIALEMVLHQGINRQIRRMCRDLRLTVLRLQRLRQGPLELGDLASGAARALTEKELAALRKAVGL